jgi:hypothetical protein
MFSPLSRSVPQRRYDISGENELSIVSISMLDVISPHHSLPSLSPSLFGDSLPLSASPRLTPNVSSLGPSEDPLEWDEFQNLRMCLGNIWEVIYLLDWVIDTNTLSDIYTHTP